MREDYYLGLDMRTGSLGWAVTNPEYEVLRRHGKALWGVRLFESASTAEERRSFRTARRRLDRRNWRIQILQEIFAEEVSKVDSGFFLRMKESKYWPEDKRDLDGNCPELPYALFADQNYTDKEYHKEFPTIYHLRKWLMETTETPDIRLIYLALHHMMKHRGHFLLSGDISKIKEFKGTFLQLVQNLKDEELDWNLDIQDEELNFIESVLKDKKLTKSTKKSRLIKELKAKSACEKAILNLLAGGTVKLADIYGREELNECERPKISFSDNGYDDYIGTVESDLAEQHYIIESAKAVYDWVILVEILGDSVSISDAKVKMYQKHKEDLAYLKKTVKRYLGTEEYRKVFVETSDKICNYSAYVGMTKKNGKKVDQQGKQCSKEEFYDFLKKNVVKNIPDADAKEYLEQEIERGAFLPKQVNKDNGVIPYQIHLYELKEILNNLKSRISLLEENEEKIIQLFTFRIPYYVGPLNKVKDGVDGKFTWAVRKSDAKVYPWNFEEVIDVEESAEKFIRA